MAATATHAEVLAIDVGELQHGQWLNTIWLFFSYVLVLNMLRSFWLGGSRRSS